MPKATSSITNRPALRRNQACRPCRKRKLKCDAARPHCGTCVKSIPDDHALVLRTHQNFEPCRHWQTLVSVPAPVGYTHPTEPTCIYDPVEGLRLAPNTDPTEKIKELEDQIAQLRERLEKQGGSSSPHSQFSHVSPAAATSPHTTENGGISLPTVRLLNIIPPDSPDTRFRSPTTSPEIVHNTGDKANSKAFMDLLFSGWNPDLPDPATLNHYIEVFFRCDPCGSRILHKPTFLASMHLSPRDPGFPHSAILHAICAAGSRWSPQNVITLADGSRRDQFAEFHASKTRQYIDKTMASGEDIFSVMQACILLSWYFYQEGRWVEVWIFAGFQTRVAVPLRLNYPGTFSTHGNDSPGAYLAPPKDLRDLESRRRTWWMTIVFDRIASVGGWLHAIDERDLGTELPLRTEDYEIQAPVPNNPQDLSSPDVFTVHPPQYTDSFILLIKSIMLFGKVTDFNVRGNLRAPTAPSKNQNPFFLPGFKELDKLVSSAFLDSLPQIYKNNTGVCDAPEGGSLDTDLFMVHIIPHAATITLHNPYINFSDPQNFSKERCIHSARVILNSCYLLSSTSLDYTRLHPFVTICWYLAAVVHVQMCRYLIEINDAENESTVWGDINVLRFAMREYGRRSPIGLRQEKLLQGVMREIVRMTAQKHSVNAGVPLYPFSHTTLFRRDEAPHAPAEETTGPAPFPVNPEYEQPFEHSMGHIGSSTGASISPNGTSNMIAPPWHQNGSSSGSPGNVPYHR